MYRNPRPVVLKLQVIGNKQLDTQCGKSSLLPLDMSSLTGIKLLKQVKLVSILQSDNIKMPATKPLDNNHLREIMHNFLCGPHVWVGKERHLGQCKKLLLPADDICCQRILYPAFYVLIQMYD
jgi:hypothetical protein